MPRKRDKRVLWAYMSFISARRGWTIFTVALVLGLLTAAIGLREAAVPTAYEQSEGVLPIWRLLAMGVGLLPALGLHSNLGHLEEMATNDHKRVERQYAVGLTLACAGGYLLLASLVLQPSLLAVITRSLAGWLGLGLISGRLLGWRLAWALPVAAACILTYWGGASAPDRHAWWDFSARSYDDLPSLLLTVCLLGGGLLAYWVSPWRRTHLSTWRRRLIPKASFRGILSRAERRNSRVDQRSLMPSAGSSRHAEPPTV